MLQVSLLSTARGMEFLCFECFAGVHTIYCKGGAEFLCFECFAGVATIYCKGYIVSLFRGCCWCPYYLLQGVWSFFVSWMLLVSLLSATRGAEFLCFECVAGIPTICCKGCGVSLFRVYCWCPYYLLQRVWSFSISFVLLSLLMQRECRKPPTPRAGWAVVGDCVHIIGAQWKLYARKVWVG